MCIPGKWVARQKTVQLIAGMGYTDIPHFAWVINISQALGKWDAAPSRGKDKEQAWGLKATLGEGRLLVAWRF